MRCLRQLLALIYILVVVCTLPALVSATDPTHSAAPHPNRIATNTTVVVNCSDIATSSASPTPSTIVVQSSTLYVLNCTEPQPVLLDFEPDNTTTATTSGGDDLHNVVVHVTGGNVVPRLSVVVGSGVNLRLHNVSLWLSDVHIGEEVVVGGGRPLFTVQGGRSIAGVSAVLENVSLRLAWVEPLVSLFTIGPAAPIGGGAPGTGGGPPTPMAGISFLVASGSVLALRSNQSINYYGGVPAILLLVDHGAHNISAVDTTLRECDILYKGGSSGHLLSVSSMGDGSSIDGHRLDVRNATIRMMFSSCSSEDPPAGICHPEPTGLVISSLFHAVQYHQRNVAIVFWNFVWIAFTADRGFDRVSDEVFMINLRGKTSRNVSVSVVSTSATARGTKTAALLYLDVIECVDLHAEVRDALANVSVYGALGAVDATRRAMVVLFPQFAVLIDSSIVFRNTVAYLFAESGESTTSAALANSALLTASATLLILTDGSNNASVTILRCTLHASVQRGTIPLFKGLPVATILLAAAFMQMLQAGLHTNLTVHIDDSAIFTNLGCSVNPGAIYVSVSAVSAALIPTANCTDCRFDITNSHVEIVSAKFDQLPPSARGSATLGDVNLYNIAAVVYAIDVSMVLSFVVPSVILDQVGGYYLAYSSVVWHHRTHTHIVNASAALVASSETLLIDDPNKVVLHLVAVATIPKLMSDSSMLLLNTSSDAVASTWFGARRSMPLLLSFTTSDLVRSSFSATNCGGLSLLLLACVGTLKLRAAELRFRRCTLSRRFNSTTGSIRSSLLPPPVVAAPYGALQDGTVFSVHATDGTAFHITNSRFDHLASLLNSSLVSLSSLTLGCNLWDGAPLAPAVIGLPLERVAYHRSTYEDDGSGDLSGVVCKGIQTETHSASFLTATGSDAMPPLPLLTTSSRVVAAASTVASVATFASALGPVVPRAAVGAVQGVLGMLRLVVACRHARSDVGTIEQNDDDDEGSAALDNPLQMSIAVDSVPPALRHAAGAVVGNTVFVMAVGVALHGCARVYKHIKASCVMPPTVIERFVLDLFPKTLWPGCLLVPLGILLEPVVKMSVVLMALGGASAGALGSGILALWVGAAACVAYRLLCVRPFPLMSVATRGKRRRQSTSGGSVSRHKRLLNALRSAMQWATEPTEFFAPPRKSQHREYAALLEAHYACAYEPYRAPCVAFFLVEYGSVVLIGVLLGVATSVGPASACSALRWCGWLVAALYMGVAAVAVRLRPFAMRSDTIATAAIHGLCGASAAASALASGGSDAAANAAERLALAASCVELLAMALSIAAGLSARTLRLVLDGRQPMVAPWAAGGASASSSRLRLRRSQGVPSRRSSMVPEPRQIDAPAAVPTPTLVPHAPVALRALIALICEEVQRNANSPVDAS